MLQPAPRRRGGARLVRRCSPSPSSRGLVWLGYVAMLTGAAGTDRAQLRAHRAGLRRRSSSRFAVPGGARARRGLALPDVLHRVLAACAASRAGPAGIVLLWGTFATLWMPWVDYQKSYRSVALELRSKIPVGATCIAQRWPGRVAGRRARLLWRHPPQAFDVGQARRLPAGAGAGQPAARVRRAARPAALDQARRRRPARRQGRALPPLPARNDEHDPAHRMQGLERSSPHHAESWRGVHLREPLRARTSRARASSSPKRAGVRYDYSRQRLGAMTLRLLAHARRRARLRRMARGAALAASRSTTPRTAPRGTPRCAPPILPPRCARRCSACKALAARVRSEQRFKRIVNLGTGGSDLGPRLLADALGDGTLDVRFAANVDPHDLERALEGADPASTLFVVVSKTFTTQETMANAAAPRSAGARKHFYAVTANVAAAQAASAPARSCRCGTGSAAASRSGRRSASRRCAPSGPTPSSEFLDGGREVDEHFAQAPLEKNIPVLMALDRRVEHELPRRADARRAAVLQRPAPAARRTCSSSRWSRTASASTAKGASVDYATAPVLWGAEGTVSQHSFHQLLHQGTQVVACDFIELGLEENLSANCARAGRCARLRHRRPDAAAVPAISGQPPFQHAARSKGCDAAKPRAADCPLRAQGLHPGRHLEHQQLRPVGRRAGQGDGKEDSLKGER